MFGDETADKTSVLNAYAGDSFNYDSLTITAMDHVSVNHTLRDGTTVKLKIWDTAGQERFLGLSRTFYKRADGVVLFFDITD